MRDIRNELLPALFGFFQRIRHGIEGICQIDDFLAAAVGHRHAGIEFPPAKAPGRIRDLRQRLRLLETVERRRL